MKFALPLAGGKLCMHFGHCEEFAIVDVDDSTKSIKGTTKVTPPPHEPGLLPRWLHDQGTTHVIAGGMGMGAQEKFLAAGIQVFGYAGNVKAAVEDLIKKKLGGLTGCPGHEGGCH